MGGKTETKTVYKNDTQSKQTRDPWGPAKPYILDTLGEARKLYNSDVGKNFFPGKTYVDASDTTLNALQGIEDRAANNELGNVSQEGLLGYMQGNDMGPANDFYRSGMDGGHTLDNSRYNSFMGDTNPHLDNTFDHAADKISDRVNSNFSKAGRYGSAAHQGKLSEDLSNFATSLYGNAYNADQNRKFSAANAMTGIDSSNLATKYAAAGSLANENDREDRKALQAIGMSPMINSAGYADLDRSLRVGAAREGYDRQELGDEMVRHNFEETNPYNRLAQYANLAGYFGSMGGEVNSNSSSSGYNNTTRRTSGLGPALGNIMGGVGFGLQTFAPNMFGGASPGMTASLPQVPNLAANFGGYSYPYNYGNY